MESTQLEDFRQLLLKQRQELIHEAERTVDGMTHTKETFADPTDRASLESNRNAMLRIRDRERKLLTKIDEALLRIEDGTYGVCDECGDRIAVERLQARPVTTMCIECQQEKENAEHRRKRW